MSKHVSVTCPHCAAALQIDAEAGVITGHEPPPKHTEKVDFDTRLKQIEADKLRAEDRMAEAMRREQSKDRIMADKFRELMENAKDDDGKPPVRDIDLD